MPEEVNIKPVDLVRLKAMSREFAIYMVNDSELDQLASGYNSIHFTLFGIGVGAFISIVITWIAEASTSSAPLSSRAIAVFVSTSLITFLFSLYCGCEAQRLRAKSGNVIDRIKNPISVPPRKPVDNVNGSI
jgi:hypothetical protein